MSRTTPVLALLAAFAGAAAQAAPDLEALERRADHRAALSRQLRDVEVELYCDHPGQALSLMRQTRSDFVASPDRAVSQGLREISEVIWHVRHGDTQQAIAMLEGARGRLNQEV